ncbi:hypothetical protein GQX74_003436 [Glossina fuscipes]|nr:hypothetical protein GQX74_003436 [Glossina fuscipes]
MQPTQALLATQQQLHKLLACIIFLVCYCYASCHSHIQPFNPQFRSLETNISRWILFPCQMSALRLLVMNFVCYRSKIHIENSQKLETFLHLPYVPSMPQRANANFEE